MSDSGSSHLQLAAAAVQWLQAAQQQSNSGTTVSSLIQQQSALNEQIIQSESNLSAQHAVSKINFILCLSGI